MEESKKKDDLQHDRWMKENIPWRAWGSWFSWGSPVGMSLGWALFILSTGVFIYLLHLSEII